MSVSQTLGYLQDLKFQFFFSFFQFQFYRPSTSRGRSLLSGTSKYISVTSEEKFLFNSESLQSKQVAAKKKDKLSCCKQKADIAEPRKTDNRKERQNHTKQWLKPTFHLNGFELVEKQELESLDINIPCYSGKDLHAQRSESVTCSWSKSSREKRGINPKKGVRYIHRHNRSVQCSRSGCKKSSHFKLGIRQ